MSVDRLLLMMMEPDVITREERRFNHYEDWDLILYYPEEMPMLFCNDWKELGLMLLRSEEVSFGELLFSGIFNIY